MSDEGRTKGASLILIMIALTILIISLIALFWEYVLNRTFNPINIALSIGTVLLSLYFISQVLKKPQNLFSESHKVTTTIRCVSCDYVSAKEFEKGDYILKEIGTCPRCGSNLIIYSIFSEVKEKERRAEQI